MSVKLWAAFFVFTLSLLYTLFAENEFEALETKAHFNKNTQKSPFQAQLFFRQSTK